jgi:hypothetical protein
LVAASASATPVEIGSTVDEPDTRISPLTAPPPAASTLSAAVLATGPPSPVAVVAALPPQAATTRVPAKAMALSRFGVATVTEWLL